MKDLSNLSNTNPFELVEAAFEAGWSPIHTIPLADEGEFIALTVKGLVRKVRNRNSVRRFKRSDKYGPARTTVVSVVSGNYLAAIAWKREF